MLEPIRAVYSKRIDSRELVNSYGLEEVKFYFTSIMPETNDSNFIWKDFEEKVNSVLVGNLGNFVYRTFQLLKKTKNVQIASKESVEFASKLVTVSDTYLNNQEFK